MVVLLVVLQCITSITSEITPSIELNIFCHLYKKSCLESRQSQFKRWMSKNLVTQQDVTNSWWPTPCCHQYQSTFFFETDLVPSLLVPDFNSFILSESMFIRPINQVDAKCCPRINYWDLFWVLVWSSTVGANFFKLTELVWSSNTCFVDQPSNLHGYFRSHLKINYLIWGTG